jgi:hypothetical protein
MIKAKNLLLLKQELMRNFLDPDVLKDGEVAQDQL